MKLTPCQSLTHSYILLIRGACADTTSPLEALTEMPKCAGHVGNKEGMMQVRMMEEKKKGDYVEIKK